MNAWTAQIRSLERHVERNSWLAALPEFQRAMRLDAMRVRGHILQVLRTSPAPIKTIQIAIEEGISDESARKHLHALRDEGLVEQVGNYPARWCAVDRG